MYKHRIVGVISLTILIMMSVFPVQIINPTQPNTAKFVLAGWDYPDEYGQGIEEIRVYQNLSGWQSLTPFGYLSDFDGNDVFNINTTATGVMILVKCWLNNTLVKADDFDDGKNYIQHSVTFTRVGALNKTPIFSQQNFTYSAGTDAQDPMFYYHYEVEIPFSPIGGETYLADVDCEIYYALDEIYYLQDGSSLSGIDFYSAGGLAEGEYGISSDGDVIEVWIMPDDAGDENVIYIFNFTDIDNTNTNSMNVSIRYKIESSTSFSYFVAYNDTTYDASTLGLSTSWITLNVTCDPKFLDYIQLYNSDFPNSVASDTLSVWIDYIEIRRNYDDWVEVADMNLYFQVYYSDEQVFLGNLALIALGLIMIPASTIYLVVGGRDKLNTDKGFWFIIIFLLGWALVIGGVMP